MNNLAFLQDMSPASMTKGVLTLHRYTQPNTPINPCPKCKQIQKNGEKGVG